MPTINQLVRKKRRTPKKKSNTPALGFNFNSLENRLNTNTNSPQKEVYVCKLELLLLKNLIQL